MTLSLPADLVIGQYTSPQSPSLSLFVKPQMSQVAEEGVS